MFHCIHSFGGEFHSLTTQRQKENRINIFVLYTRQKEWNKRRNIWKWIESKRFRPFPSFYKQFAFRHADRLMVNRLFSFSLFFRPLFHSLSSHRFGKKGFSIKEELVISGGLFIDLVFWERYSTNTRPACIV